MPDKEDSFVEKWKQPAPGGQIYIAKDEIAKEIDILADLCEHWKKWRKQGLMPRGVRAGIVTEAKIIDDLTRAQPLDDIQSRIDNMKL